MAEIGPGPARTAFQEAAAAATDQAAAEQFGITTETVEAPAVEAPVAAVVEAPAPVETPAETLLAGKYKTAEELERGYEELKAFADRQGNEKGEQRALIEAYAERLAALEARANTPAPRQITPELIEQDPAQATQLAYAQKDTASTALAYRQWLLEDPGPAASWYAASLAAEQTAELRAEMVARDKKFEERFAPIQQQQDQTVLSQSVQQLPDDVRSFLSDRQAVNALAEEFPTLGNAIVSGSPAEKLNAITALHGIHRGRTADTLNQAVTDVARTTAQEAQAVRDEAYVASSTASEAESLTYEQQEQQRMTEFALRRSTPFGGGLVIPGKQ